ncbi:hypothetical protein ACJZ2D_003106 [Fusarium nematophilum]
MIVPREHETPFNKAPVVRAIAALLMVITILSALTRIVTRLATVRSLKVDDILVAAATVVSIAQSIAVISQGFNGLGKLHGHTTYQVSAILKAQYASDALFLIALLLAKLSATRTIWGMVPWKRRYVILLTEGLIALWASSSVVASLFQCSLPNPWDYIEGQCFNRLAFWIYVGALNMVTDLAITAIIVEMLIGLKLSGAKKTLVIGVFASRVLIIPPIIYHLYYYKRAVESDNPIFYMWEPVVLLQVIQCLSVMATCLPYLKPLLDSLADSAYLITGDLRAGDSKSRSRSNPEAYGPSSALRTIAATASHRRQNYEMMGTGADSDQGKASAAPGASGPSGSWDGHSHTSQTVLVEDTWRAGVVIPRCIVEAQIQDPSETQSVKAIQGIWALKSSIPARPPERIDEVDASETLPRSAIMELAFCTSLTLYSLIPCQGCRARKKRCYHDQGVRRPADDQAFQTESINVRTSSQSPDLVHEYDPESVLEDLSPLADPASGHQARPRTSPSPSCQGPVHPPKPPSLAQKARRQVIWYKRHRRTAATPELSEPHKRYLEDVGAFLELPRSTTEGLLPIYISLLDDLIPTMDAASVFRDFSNGRSSIYLVRAICLVVCKAKQAAPFLRLSEDGPLLNHMDFASKLLAGLDAAIKADLEPDRVTKIQVLALMHLDNDGQGGVDRSSSYLSQAINEAWAVSLHFKVNGNPDQEQCDYLWWCLRNFDRLNKPIMGAAPFLIDDTDISIKRIAARKGSYRSQLMGVALVLGDLMATATKVYKASSTARVDDCHDFPSFLELTSGTGFDSFHRSHRGYLEIWYHLAAMLSCRHSGPGSVHYDRRLASADGVISIVAHGQHESLPPLPLVPYATSMATTVIYRALRDGQRDVHAACSDLRLCCDALDALGERWTSAQGVARLANRLWRSTKSATTDRHPDDPESVHPRERGQSDSGWETVARQPSSRQHHRSADLVEPIIPTPVSLYADQTLCAGHGSDNHKGQFIDPWIGIDASCPELNGAFDNLFDYGMSDVLRDPATWEFLQLAGD